MFRPAGCSVDCPNAAQRAHARGRRHHQARPPGPPPARRPRSDALRPHPRRRLRRLRRALPGRDGIIDELGTLTFARDPRAHERAGARALRTPASVEGDGVGDHVPQPPLLHRGHGRAAPSSAPTRCTSTRRSPARSSPRWSSARGPRAIVFDEEFDEARRTTPPCGASASSRWHEDGVRARRPDARVADRGAATPTTSCRRPRRAGS